MSTWIKDNKSIASVIAVGSLAFLSLATYGILELANKGDQTDSFNNSKRAIESAASRAQTPTANTVKETEANINDYEQRLQDTFDLYMDYRPKPSMVANISPDAFRTKLNTLSTEFKKKAAERKVKVHSSFLLGFERYGSASPKQQATGTLQYELDGINWIMNRALDHNLTEVVRVFREELPSEKAEVTTPAPSKTRSARSPRGKTPVSLKKVAPAYEKMRFGMALKGKRPIVVNLLNDMLDSKEYLFLISGIKVTNEVSKAITIKPPAAPPKAPVARGGQLNLNAAFGGAKPADTAKAPEKEAPKVVVSPVTGDDQVDFFLIVDMVLLPTQEASEEAAEETTDADTAEASTNA